MTFDRGSRARVQAGDGRCGSRNEIGNGNGVTIMFYDVPSWVSANALPLSTDAQVPKATNSPFMLGAVDGL